MEGVRFGGVNINNIRYADGTALIADTEEKVQRLVNVLNEGCGRYDLKVNIGTTDLLGVTKRRDQLPVNIRLGGCLLK